MSSAKSIHITKSVKSNSRIRRMRSRRKKKSDTPQQHSLLQLQQQFGNQAVGRMVQVKLNIGKPDNHYEREADQVADKVMRMPEPVRHEDEETTVQTKPLANQITPLVQAAPEEQPEENESLVQAIPDESSEKNEDEQMIAAKPLVQRQPQAGENEEKGPLQTKLAIQRQEAEEEEEPVQAKQASGLSSQNEKFAPGHIASTNSIIQRVCAECEEEMQRQPSLQPKGVRRKSSQINPTTAANIHSMKGRGSPLPRSVRSFFEPRFGADFNQVRVHTNSRAAETAKSINARAFTIGENIAFGTGQYSPESHGGRQLLAHELTHVMQQSQVDRTSAVAFRVQRAPNRTGASAPSPPDWLGPWKSNAVHVKGDIWDIKLPSLGESWVGPYVQLSSYIKEQGFAGKMEAAHIVGGEHLQDIGSAFSYDKAPCVAVDKSLHATWTKQTANLQSKAGPMGGRATKKWSRPNVTMEDVAGLYDELYRGHPELQVMSRNIVKGKGAPRPARVTTSVARPAPETKPETKAKKGTSPEPGGEATSGSKSRVGAGTGTAVISTGVTKGRVRAGVEFGVASGKTAIKIKDINIADYPPDKQGPITRFFKDRPVLAQFSAIGASMTMEYMKGKAFDKIQEHFESALHDAREEFELTFRDTKTLLAEKGVTQTRKAYQTALVALRAPNIRRDFLLILAAFSPPEQVEEAIRTAKRLGSTHKIRGSDIQNFLTAADAYVVAMDSVQNVLYEHLRYRPGLPAIAKDIFARAAVLKSIGADLQDFFWEMVQFAWIPSVEIALMDIYWVSNNFSVLGDRLWQFGVEVEQRHREYRKLLKNLDWQFEMINRAVLKWDL
jgi:Domain of unknown function (DUF4157)